MAEFKMPKNGEICWRELASTNLPAAKSFYQSMFGWDMQQSKVTPMEYSEIVVDNEAVGGMMPIDEKWGQNPPPSHWIAYVAVDDADAVATKIKENGGTILMEPFDAPGVGRIALASDPSGARFNIIQLARPE